MELRVSSGDITLPQPIVRSAAVGLEPALPMIQISVDSTVANVDPNEWLPLIIIVRNRELHRWQFDPQRPPPMDGADMHQVVTAIGNSTVTFQLFLAAVEIANHISFIEHPTEAEAVLRTLSGVLLPYGARGLYFPRRERVAEVGRHELDELIFNNKLCALEFRIDERPDPSFRTYYVPYATPVIFTRPVSPDARRVWEGIRNDYFLARGR